MEILIVSERFWPGVGGVETVTRLLAAALVRAGNRVTVATNQDGRHGTGPGPLSGLRVRERPTAPHPDLLPFGRGEGGPSADHAVEHTADPIIRVVRHPAAFQLAKQFKAAEFVILQGLPLRLGWPLLLRRRAALVVHHAQPAVRERFLRRRLRARLAGRVAHAAVSRALALELPWATEMILPNPYEAALFWNDRVMARSRDIIFVGRFIPEKGAPILVEALSILWRRQVRLTATFVGDGPEKQNLHKLVQDAKLGRVVSFTGQLTGGALAQLMNQHHLLVIPSVCPEPFGIVALEGLACGCVVIASNAGGLPEAIGPYGVLFPTGDPMVLAAKIQECLASGAERSVGPRSRVERHLRRHHPDHVAANYLEAIRSLRPNPSIPFDRTWVPA